MKKEDIGHKAKWLIPVLLVILVVAVAVAVVFTGGQRAEKMPWEAAGSKQPAEYTWEEFQNLKGIQKDHFFESFGSAESFEQWMAAAGGSAQPTVPAVENPWEQDGKQPGDYTWEEYLNLTYEQKDAFFEAFDSAEAFEIWKGEVNASKETETPVPAQTETEKPSATVSWEDFMAMTPEEQEAFFESFESPEAFEAWMNAEQPVVGEQEPEKEKYPWQNGGKYPSEYTWEEFLALSPEAQEAFFLSFSSPEQFETWMNRVKPAE